MFIVCVEAVALLQSCFVLAPVYSSHINAMLQQLSACYDSLYTFRILSLTVVVADSIWAVEPRVLPTRPDILTLVRAPTWTVCLTSENLCLKLKNSVIGRPLHGEIVMQL